MLASSTTPVRPPTMPFQAAVNDGSCWPSRVTWPQPMSCTPYSWLRYMLVW